LQKEIQKTEVSYAAVGKIKRCHCWEKQSGSTAKE
jgi:hypothetical protein